MRLSTYFLPTILVVSLVFLTTIVQAQSGFFVPVSTAKARLANPAIPNARFYQLRTASLRAYLSKAPVQQNPNAASLQLEIPLPNGTTEMFSLYETTVLSPALAAENPTFKTYAGQGVAHPDYTIRMSLTSLGFEALIWGVDGDAVYIKKTSADPKSDIHTAYFSRDARKVGQAKGFGMQRCNGVSSTSKPALSGLKPSLGQAKVAGPESFSFGSTMRVFRLAIATTGEWTRNAGGYPGVTDPAQIRTNALAVVVASVNRINGIYERELSCRFLLVNPPTSTTSNILYDDPDTDPYDNTDSGAQLALNHTSLNQLVGTANYDIGHLFGTGGGGLAALGSLCDNAYKGEGYSARGTDTGDPFVVDYVAHEIGHQFGMDHTYNQADVPGTTCTTREPEQAYEVASGSTIMSYVGICADRNLQRNTDFAIPAFHVASLKQAYFHLTGAASGCGSTTGANAIPTVSTGAAYTIPRLTPFTLTATANDADAADVPNLLYSWEEFDKAPSASGNDGIPANTYDVDDDGVLRPLFRAYSPRSGNQRTFPSMLFVLNPQTNETPGENQPPLSYTGVHPTGFPGAVCEDGVTCVLGERLPTVPRVMNFRVSVRDQRGGNTETGTTVTVVNTPGAFRLTAFDSASQLAGGSQQTVTWNVATTDQAPINCANVRLLLSTDGGQTFPTTLLTSTPNTGSANVIIPNVASTQARLKVEAVGNIFFDVSNTNVTIQATEQPVCPPACLAIQAVRIR
jgi:hypothetical protein